MKGINKFREEKNSFICSQINGSKIESGKVMVILLTDEHNYENTCTQDYSLNSYSMRKSRHLFHTVDL